MRALRLGTLLCVVASALPAGAQGSPACPSSPSMPLAPFDTARTADLAGAWEVELVDTSTVRGPFTKHRGRLTLWLQDSQPSRPGLPARPVQAGQRLLAGAWDAQGTDTGAYWRRMSQRDHRAPGAVWSAGFLRLGEFGNGMGISLYVSAAGHDVLHGKWNSGSGMGVTVDFTGARTPESAGYYCARRIP